MSKHDAAQQQAVSQAIRASFAGMKLDEWLPAAVRREPAGEMPHKLRGPVGDRAGAIRITTASG